MENEEILKMLFETHHNQLVERRRKIHAITERTIGIMIVCTGWLILGDTTLSRPMCWLLTGTVIILAITACRLQAGHNKTYIEICRVVQKLDRAFGLYDKGKYISDEAIYPDAWRSFGTQSVLKMLGHHWTAIGLITTICILVAFTR